jgi:tight adherence protein C
MGPLFEIAVFLMLSAVSAGFIVAGVRDARIQMRLIRRLDGLARTPPKQRLAGTVARALGGIVTSDATDRQEVARNLHIAGYYHPHAPLIFAWVRLGVTAAVWLFAAGVLVLLGKWQGAGPYMPWGAAGMAYILSKRVLGWSAARRRRKVEAELPFTLDVLQMTLEAGVSLDQSFRTFVQLRGRAAPIVAAAVAALVADLDRGMPHEAALDRWAERLGVNGSRDLASLFKRNLAHGSELSGALAAMAAEFSDKRVSVAREAVGRKAAQITVIMVVFFMPALFLVLAGPAFVTLTSTLIGIGR